jgi:hypothetical protein
MPKRHFIYAQKKSRAFPNFPKLANAKGCYVHLTLYRILPKLDGQHGRTARNTLQPLSKGVHLMQLSFTEFLWTSVTPDFTQNLQKM